MKFGLHHSSRLDSPDPAEAYEAVKAKAPRRPMSSAGYLPATGPRWRQSASDWLPWSVPGFVGHRVRGPSI